MPPLGKLPDARSPARMRIKFEGVRIYISTQFDIMDITRNDYSDVRSNATDDQKFEKAYQVVDRPQITGRDIHEDYLRSPPRNQPPEYGDTSVSRHPGIEDGAREPVDPKRDGVLGDEAASKVTKQSDLEAVTTQKSVHP